MRVPGYRPGNHVHPSGFLATENMRCRITILASRQLQLVSHRLECIANGLVIFDLLFGLCGCDAVSDQRLACPAIFENFGLLWFHERASFALALALIDASSEAEMLPARSE